MKTPLTGILFVFCTILLALLLVLYRQNKSYKRDNSELILLNDSIMSVNIELKKMVDTADISEVKPAIAPENKK
jgi:hypothetical protein